MGIDDTDIRQDGAYLSGMNLQGTYDATGSQDTHLFVYMVVYPYNND